MPVLLFQQGAALPNLSADASLNELCVSGRMLGEGCQGWVCIPGSQDDSKSCSCGASLGA